MKPKPERTRTLLPDGLSYQGAIDLVELERIWKVSRREVVERALAESVRAESAIRKAMNRITDSAAKPHMGV